MISLNKVSLQRGGKPLLTDANLRIQAGQRVGIIGANGCGKSSLFQLLLNELHADTGEVALPGQLRIAHMGQEVLLTDRLALDHVLDGDRELRETERAIGVAEKKEDYQSLALAYDKLDAIHGHSAPSRAQQLLHGLGFSTEDEQRRVGDFSGGWRIRLNLAQALMCPSDLLLLDEPTNHLDLDATLWLEQWMKAYRGTLLLISHDRDFLDSVTSHIVHIEQQTIAFYRGNYSAFERQRSEKLALQQAQYQKQQQRRVELQRFVDRFRAKATKARQAQSRVKALQRMTEIGPAHVDSPFNFKFSEAPEKSHTLLSLEKAAMGYDAKAILSGVNLRVEAGTRFGLLGANGAGKSTLLKSLVGELPLLSGESVRADNLRVGYFAQHQLEALDLAASPLLHLQRLTPKASEQSIRDFLGGFNFYGDQATDSIEYFSGGEKARLALAIVVWLKPNLLVMDEPTNHLDLDMRQALTLALQAFSGALILVSHDRHLLRNSVDEFLLLADGSIDSFEGDLDDYQRWLLARERNDQAAAKQNPEKNGGPRTDRKEQRREQAAQRAKWRPLEKKIQQIEKKLADNTSQLAELEEKLLDTGIYAEDQKQNLRALLQQQGELKQAAEQLEEQWLELGEQLELLKNS